MKKSRMIALLLAVVMALSTLTGCSLFKPTAVSITQKVMKNVEKVQSFTGNIKLDYEGPASISGMEVDLTLRADCDMESSVASGVSHVKGTIGADLPVLGNIDLPIESYQQIENDEPVAYMSMDGNNWIKVKSEKETDGNGTEESSENTAAGPDLKTGLGILQKIARGEIKAELAEETEMKGDKEVYRMDVTVSGDLIAEVLKAAEEASDEGTSIPQDLDLTGADANIVFYVYKEEMLPASIVIDCTALGSVLIREMLKDGEFSASADKCVITIDNLEYNTVDELQIPQEVISSATDSDDFNLFENASGL